MKTLMKVIHPNDQYDKRDIDEFFKKHLTASFGKVSFNKKDSGKFIARVKTRIMNPVAKLVCNYQVQRVSNKIKISIDAEQKTTFWFWFTLLLIGGSGVGIAIAIWMYISQKQQCLDDLESCLNRLDNEIGKF